MPFPVVLLLASAGLTLVAVVFFLLALRRRFIGQSPHCAACRYNLSARPADSARCPECGADTTLPKSITTGLPERNRRKLLLAASILGVSLLVLASVATVVYRTVDLTPYKPLRWLEYDLASTVPTQRAAALAEFQRHLPPTPHHSPAPYVSLADRLLARQKNLTQPWRPEMGDLLVHLHSVNILDDARWTEYLTQTIRYDVAIRPTLVRGNPLPLAITYNHRAGNHFWLGSRTEFVLTLSDGTVTHPVKVFPRGYFGSPVFDDSLTTRQPRLILAQNPDLAPFADGPVTATFTITTQLMRTNLPGQPPPPEVPRSIRLTHTFTLPFALLASTASDLRPTSGPSLQADLESALRDGPARPQISFNANDQTLYIFFEANPLPESLSHDLIFLINGVEYPITTLTVSRGTSGAIFASPPTNRLPNLPTPLPPEVTLILRPNPRASLSTPSPNFADVTLRFEDVPLKVLVLGTQPTTRPATAPTTRP